MFPRRSAEQPNPWPCFGARGLEGRDKAFLLVHQPPLLLRKCDAQAKRKTIGSVVSDLVNFLYLLPNDPSTLRHIILSSYSTRPSWTLYQNSNVELEDNSEQELTEEIICTIWSYIPNVLYRVILDEGQHVRSSRTKTHISVQLLTPSHISVATVTPMVNRKIARSN